MANSPGMGGTMIVIVKKSNIVLIGLVFLLLIAIYSLNIGINEASSVVSITEGAKRVVVDAGHGGEDPGAVSGYSGVSEKEITLKIAFFLRDLLEKDGYHVVMTRTEDVLQYKAGTERIFDKRKQDLTRRKKIMDDEGDIAVSIHLNQFSQTQYSGAQAFYPPDSAKSQELAICIQKALKEHADPANNREALVKEERIIIFRDLKTPTALVECGFLSHKEEERKLGTEEYQKRLAEAIKKGIDDYFGK
jgi:N-acetylmuramoyl-L-alanine amidase